MHTHADRQARNSSPAGSSRVRIIAGDVVAELTRMEALEKWPRSAYMASVPVMHSSVPPSEVHPVKPLRMKYRNR